jgi:hypothetical protein
MPKEIHRFVLKVIKDRVNRDNIKIAFITIDGAHSKKTGISGSILRLFTATSLDRRYPRPLNWLRRFSLIPLNSKLNSNSCSYFRCRKNATKIITRSIQCTTCLLKTLPSLPVSSVLKISHNNNARGSVIAVSLVKTARINKRGDNI